MRQYFHLACCLPLLTAALSYSAEVVVWESDFDETTSYNIRHCFNDTCEAEDVLADVVPAPPEFTDAIGNSLIVVLSDSLGSRWGSLEPLNEKTNSSFNIPIPEGATSFTYTYSYYAPPNDGFDEGEDQLGHGTLRWNSSPDTIPGNNLDGFQTSFLAGFTTVAGVSTTNIFEGDIPTDGDGNLPTHVMPLIGLTNGSVAGSQSDRVGVFGYIDNIKLSFEVEGVELACDFDTDGACGLSDIDALMAAIVSGENDGSFDLNDDGTVTDSDRDIWLSDAATVNGGPGPYLLGDADLDGTVGTSDLNRVGLNWRDTNAVQWSEGNFVSAGDPGVNTSDLNVVGLNWQTSWGAEGAAAAVPEPNLFGQSFSVLIATLFCAGRRKARAKGFIHRA